MVRYFCDVCGDPISSRVLFSGDTLYTKVVGDNDSYVQFYIPNKEHMCIRCLIRWLKDHVN